MTLLTILGMFIVFAGLVTIVFGIIFGIVGLKTKQYNQFKKTIKVFGLLCAAFVLVLVAYAMTVSVQQKNTKEIVNSEFGYKLSLPSKYVELLTAVSVEEITPEQKPSEDYPPNVEIQYTMDARGTIWEQDTVNVFSIVAYPRAWWDANIEERDTGKLFPTPFMNGEDATILGVFLGKNNSYAITFMPSIDGFYGCTEDQKELKKTKQCTAIDYARYDGPTRVVVFDP